MLAGLFTLRLFLGVVAIGVGLSPWLFVFAMALFLSLSSAKRHTELSRARVQGAAVSGRGYRVLPTSRCCSRWASPPPPPRS